MDFCFAMTYNPIELPPIRFSTRSPEAAAADSPKGRKKGRKSTTIATTTTTTHSPHSLSPKPPLKKREEHVHFPNCITPFVACTFTCTCTGGIEGKKNLQVPCGQVKSRRAILNDRKGGFSQKHDTATENTVRAFARTKQSWKLTF